MDNVDDEFCLFRPILDYSQVKAPLNVLHERVYQVLSILRCVPPRTLYVFSGWKATSRTSNIAREEFSKWIHQEGKKARIALMHAAKLFGCIRSGNINACYDPLCLPIATLFI